MSLAARTLIFLAVLGTGIAAAQGVRQRSFEVISIKPTLPGSNPSRATRIVGNSVRANTSVALLIRTAYSLEGYQIAKLPEWAEYQFYDIAGIADSKWGITQDEYKLMCQALLAERFQLKSHRETKDFDVYALVVGKGGSKMKPAGAASSYSFKISKPGFWQVTSEDTAHLARSLAKEVGEIVLDETGLAGKFDFSLHWSPEGAAELGDNPSIFTAVQQQLGLRLERRRQPMSILVIDHVERPSAN